MIYDSLIGKRLDEYHLEDLVGQGGMARVYRGFDTRLERWVAIKVIDKPFRADPDYIRRFEREAQAIAQLEHPHIVRLYRYGESAGLLYMVLQFVDGVSLDQVLAGYRAEGSFIEPAEASRVIREICSALDYAHSRGVIHRDVKPANIILNQHGHAILVDFGLVLLADTRSQGEAFGTPHYMAPEQVRSSAGVVPQSDLYALGVILYEMFTNRSPFEGVEPLEVATMHLTEPPPPPHQFRPDLAPAVEAVILKALAKQPADRYPTGAALAGALDHALVTARRSTEPPPTLTRLSIPERVATRLSDRPELPLLAEVPGLEETQPAGAAREVSSRDEADELLLTRRSAVPVPPGGSKAARPAWTILAGLALMTLLGLVLGAALVAFWQPRRPVAAQPPAGGAPAAPTALPEPQLVADTVRDFAIPGEAWSYAWSEPDENDFETMDFADRQYGACYYADDAEEDYVRICQGSAHPGNEADVAWSWQGQEAGRIRVVRSFYKIDQGGDGVVLIAYHNSEAVEGQRLEPEDTQGVRNEPWFEVDVQPGDRLTFVLKKNDGAEYDHTAVRLQIYKIE